MKIKNMKKCRMCKELFLKRSMSHIVCSPKCAGEFARIDREKKEADARRESRAADRKRKEEMKTRSDWMKEAQAAFNAFVRARDADKPCICCNRTSEKDFLTGSNWDCGHYRSTGSAPHLRFNEDNAHRQLSFCNQHRAGNAVAYRIGLIARIGLERVEALEADQSTKKWTIAELKAIKAHYKAKLRELLAARAAGSGE